MGHAHAAPATSAPKADASERLGSTRRKPLDPARRGIELIEVINVLVGAVVSALLVGYLAGLLSFKVKDRWCPDCGATTTDLSRQRAGRAR